MLCTSQLSQQGGGSKLSGCNPDPSAHPQVRDLYWTVRNFRQRVLDFLRYRRVTANLDERFQVSVTNSSGT